VSEIVITIAVAVFLAGLVMGVIVIICVGIRQEERDFLRTGLVSMTRRAPSLFSAGARSVLAGAGISANSRVSFPAGSASEDVRAYKTGAALRGGSPGPGDPDDDL
jgi:hypothetical protein